MLGITPLRIRLPAGWARVQVSACGLCGTDLHVVEGMTLQPGVEYPLRPGHEVAGTVREINANGLGPLPEDVHVGAPVVLHPLAPCGECAHCATGVENLCSAALTLGFHVAGGMADEVIWPATRLVGVEGIPMEQAALLPDAVATAYRAFTIAVR